MKWKDGGTTSPLLLKRVADWADQPAWFDFFRTYDPLIRSWCGGYGLDGSTLEDLCQQIWIELAARIRTYHYDPGRAFRGWLRQFCHSRAIDLLRKRKTELVRSLADQPAEALFLTPDAIDGPEHEETDSRRLLLLCQAEQTQQTVKQRLEPQTWQAFWRIAVEGCSIRETADAMGTSYAAAFAAQKRVGRMLRAEGKIRLTRRHPGGPEAIAPEMS
jgi:RNA polymerase sigma factor (sigma-70 family)